MTLTKVLQIEPKYLQYDDLRAFAYVEKRWQQDGCPVGKWELINFLERMLQELKANGLGYPKVLLLRKKEIQRNAFAVRHFATETPQLETCSACAGTGWTASNGGHRPCSCTASKPHRKQLEKWGMKL